MITVHHLEQSRSFRILWLLEELGLPYDVVEYKRHEKTRLAPPELEGPNALGKAPVIEDDGRVLFESGAIIDYLIRRHGGGRFAPDPASVEYDLHQAWLHYAEGSAMLPVMLNMYVTTRGGETPALRARLNDELTRHRDYVAAALAASPYLTGAAPTGADIQMEMVAASLNAATPGAASPAIADWLDRLRARPAYARAVERGGDPTFRRAAAT